MAIHGAGAPVKTVMVAGKEAVQVRAGTGTSNVAVWDRDPLPIRLGAQHWLPFTTTVTQDLGLAGAQTTWSASGARQDGGWFSSGVVYNSASAFNSDQGATIAVWLSPIVAGNYNTPVIGADSQYSKLQIEYSSQLQPIVTAQQGDNQRRSYTVPRTLTSGGTHFLAATLESVSGTNARTQLYVDGQSPWFANFSGGTQYPQQTSSLQVWSVNNAVDDVMVFNRVLTSSEVAALYAAGRTP